MGHHQNVEYKYSRKQLHQEKMLFMYLFDLHIISRKVLRILPLNKALHLGGSLSLK